MTRFLSHSLLVILSFIFLLPFGWIASLAFKRQIDILMTNIISPISYGNFIKLFASKESTFSNDISNSLLIITQKWKVMVKLERNIILRLKTT